MPSQLLPGHAYTFVTPIASLAGATPDVPTMQATLDALLGPGAVQVISVWLPSSATSVTLIFIYNGLGGQPVAIPVQPPNGPFQGVTFEPPFGASLTDNGCAPGQSCPLG